MHSAINGDGVNFRKRENQKQKKRICIGLGKRNQGVADGIRNTK
jgi:hypothetical protein